MRPALTINCSATCSRCSKAVTGKLFFDGGLTVCDSTGFIIAGSRKLRVVCDPCAKKAGLPGGEVVTEDDLTDAKKRERLVNRLARGLIDPE